SPVSLCYNGNVRIRQNSLIFCLFGLYSALFQGDSFIFFYFSEVIMDLSMENFLAQVTANPLLLIAVLLTLGVILVNGWTDAPNAIATCVVTRCMSARAAILMAAVFNFLGVFLMSMLNATVAETITKMVD